MFRFGSYPFPNGRRESSEGNGSDTSTSTVSTKKFSCACCETVWEEPRNTVKSEEAKLVEKLAVDHLCRRILECEGYVFNENLTVTADLIRCSDVLKTITLCETCTNYFLESERRILKVQKMYLDRTTGSRDFREILTDPWFDLKKFAFYRLNPLETSISNSLNLIQRTQAQSQVHGMTAAPTTVEEVNTNANNNMETTDSNSESHGLVMTSNQTSFPKPRILVAPPDFQISDSSRNDGTTSVQPTSQGSLNSGSSSSSSLSSSTSSGSILQACRNIFATTSETETVNQPGVMEESVNQPGALKGSANQPGAMEESEDQPEAMEESVNQKNRANRKTSKIKIQQSRQKVASNPVGLGSSSSTVTQSHEESQSEETEEEMTTPRITRGVKRKRERASKTPTPSPTKAKKVILPALMSPVVKLVDLSLTTNVQLCASESTVTGGTTTPQGSSKRKSSGASQSSKIEITDVGGTSTPQGRTSKQSSSKRKSTAASKSSSKSESTEPVGTSTPQGSTSKQSGSKRKSTAASQSSSKSESTEAVGTSTPQGSTSKQSGSKRKSTRVSQSLPKSEAETVQVQQPEPEPNSPCSTVGIKKGKLTKKDESESEEEKVDEVIPSSGIDGDETTMDLSLTTKSKESLKAKDSDTDSDSDSDSDDDDARVLRKVSLGDPIPLPPPPAKKCKNMNTLFQQLGLVGGNKKPLENSEPVPPIQNPAHAQKTRMVDATQSAHETEDEGNDTDCTTRSAPPHRPKRTTSKGKAELNSKNGPETQTATSLPTSPSPTKVKFAFPFKPSAPVFAKKSVPKSPSPAKLPPAPSSKDDPENKPNKSTPRKKVTPLPSSSTQTQTSASKSKPILDYTLDENNKVVADNNSSLSDENVAATKTPTPGRGFTVVCGRVLYDDSSDSSDDSSD